MTQSLKKTPAPPRTPLLLRLIRGGLRWLGKVAPGLSSRLAYRLWFYPRRFDTPAREKRWLADAEPVEVKHNHERLAGYQWGAGPVVLLIHGWDGRGSQMAAFAGPLAAAGYRSVAVDLPAHGQSSGRRTNMAEAADAINAIAESVGPVEAVIGHSFGAGALARSLVTGLKVNKAILISPPANLRWMADSFYSMLDLSPNVQRRIEALINRDYGESIWQEVSADYNLRGSSIPGLIFHDHGDRDIPFSQGERIADAWPAARLIPTDGLGHRRILRNQEVIDTCVEFIRTPAE
ncbi:MAG: alpha/beta hydrolase [Acidiferrobacterales bacterium]|nr:alpha/beta hydrolase [Acidiferrobacterales bacterium]